MKNDVILLFFLALVLNANSVAGQVIRDRLEIRERIYRPHPAERMKLYPYKGRWFQGSLPGVKRRPLLDSRPFRRLIWRDGVMTRKEQYVLRQYRLRHQFRLKGF